MKAEVREQGGSRHAGAVLAAAAAAAKRSHAHVSTPAIDANTPFARVVSAAVADDKAAQKKLSMILDLIDAAVELSSDDHGTLLMPSGYAAMLDLCEALQSVGSVASMLGPSWGFHQRIDWASAVAMNADSKFRHAYHPLLDTHVNGNAALLEVFTTFPSMGVGSAEWVMVVREALVAWEAAHPGYRAAISGGASETADTRSAVLDAMWSYIGISVALIMVVVFFTFRSVMVAIRLALALLFTLGATYGVAVVVYQTPLLHGLFPCLVPFNGLTFEVVPMVTGVAIALGLDYDIFLVSRIVEFRTLGASDRASIFHGATKAGGVITGAGLIMALAFSGLCFSDKLLFQQFGVLLVTSVLFDTFVVRTVLVPALMLIAEEWNWWPRTMPLAKGEFVDGEDVYHSIDDAGLDMPMLRSGANNGASLR
jgi:hypothetical protein